MAFPDEFETGYNGGIYVTANNRTACDHLVAVIGFGGGNTADAHWVVQNSFGTVWGEGLSSSSASRGYFRIKRHSALSPGEHNLGIELACSWVMPRATDRGQQ